MIWWMWAVLCDTRYSQANDYLDELNLITYLNDISVVVEMNKLPLVSMPGDNTYSLTQDQE